MDKKQIVLNVNGKDHQVLVSDSELLLDVIREKLGLTGTKRGCDVGECGACTVLMDGKPVTSCLVLAVSAVGHKVVTIEGLAQSELLPIQKAFIEKHAVQCGFCTPGMIMSVVALLAENPDPTEDQIVQAIAGNLCRCGTYTNIISAVRSLRVHE